MENFTIKLWRKADDEVWTVEINGRVYESVDADLAKILVKHAIVEAQQPKQT